jgi:hypothetical protein
MQKPFEAVCSFLLFGSAATGLIMIWVLVSEYKIKEWGLAPALILTLCIFIFLSSWAWYKRLKITLHSN